LQTGANGAAAKPLLTTRSCAPVARDPLSALSASERYEYRTPLKMSG
jgi:hypothetical protein